MSFIRVKTIKGQKYFYLVENQRNAEGKPRQVVLEYLGKSPELKGEQEKLGNETRKTFLEKELLEIRRKLKGLNTAKWKSKLNKHEKIGFLKAQEANRLEQLSKLVKLKTSGRVLEKEVV